MESRTPETAVDLAALELSEAEIDEGLEQQHQDAALATLRAGLQTLWGEIDDDFEDRFVRRVRERLLDREALAALGDLLGLGLHTGRVLFATQTRPRSSRGGQS